MLQDKWQALTNLSITAGVRYDYHGGMTEKYGDMFNFDPALYDVTGTIGQPDLTSSIPDSSSPETTSRTRLKGVSASTLDGRQWGISPRLGFAWSPKAMNSKLVISGGGGMYYDRGELFTYLSQPAGGSIGGPFGVTESSPLVSVASRKYRFKFRSDTGEPLGRPGIQYSRVGIGWHLHAAEFRPGRDGSGLAGSVESDDGICPAGFILLPIRQELQRLAKPGRIHPLHPAAELWYITTRTTFCPTQSTTP